MHIKEAITAAGGVSTVARKLSINPVSVYEWITKNRIPADRVLPLSGLTGWLVTPHMIDAVLYPNATDGIPAPQEAEL